MVRGMLGSRGKAVALLALVTFLINLTGCSLFANRNSATAGVEKKLDLAVKYMAENKFKEAVLAYNEVIKIDRKNVEAYKGLSLAYIMQNKTDEARAVLENGLESLQGDQDVMLTVAGLLADQGETRAAENVYKDLLKQAPSYQVYNDYSLFLANQGKTDEAISLLTGALKQTPADYHLSAVLGDLYATLGKQAEALSCLATSIENHTDQTAALHSLDSVYNGKWNDLINAGDQYVTQRKTTSGYILKLYGLFQNGQYNDAVKLYENLPSAAKRVISIRLIAAQSLSKLGQEDKAAMTLGGAKTDQIKDAFLIADLAEFYLENGDQDEAQRLAMLGIRQDDAVMKNYVVMFKITSDRVWLYRFILDSQTSPYTTIRAMEAGGFKLADSRVVIEGDLMLEGGKYHGPIAYGMANGRGTLIWPNGNRYVGDFICNIREGRGTYTWSDGAAYAGGFKKGMKSGQGKTTWPDGCWYNGEYRNDLRNGHGTAYYSDGAKYVGEFKEDEKSGQGTMTYDDGGKYIGEWKNDKRNGHGTLIFSDGSKYVGEYKNDMMNGYGTEYYPRGMSQSGVWKNDRYIGKQ